ncbi:hypothetical protein DICSQDRAFT_128244 [Dichomitus squalens LYAD-421 SS1]|uniref:Uncharacterized protein n=1 Tax=Dichomitus squalens (strain LYAD-421) TaxID=732165 RepID=R7SU19_DICSQ|nr:uncharacterized protein DICSQDRAFT_128244 [Dichomitus squalens LYAD-421 SS1]EJF59571.1 hypothetical protein DICSQDRAFT_128244 [Dichomitus squalens LYAD-421 SS1]
MPLFGKHKHQDKAAAREARHEPQQGTNLAGDQPTNAPGQNYGTNSAHHGVHPQGQQGFDSVRQGANPGMTGAGQNQPVSGNQAGIGAGVNASGNGVPPASHINTSNQTSGRGTHRLEGKAEKAVGSLVGSQALKERGFQKEQEAGAFKTQSAELAEAERLEKEALMRRERAVAHGAHPANMHLGGLQNANTLSDVTGNTGSGGTDVQYGSGGY